MTNNYDLSHKQKNLIKYRIKKSWIKNKKSGLGTNWRALSKLELLCKVFMSEVSKKKGTIFLGKKKGKKNDEDLRTWI